MKLEDFFLRIVEEAQAANIHTYGARKGGELPEFLQKSAAVAAQSVVESLVEASGKHVPSPPTVPTPMHRPAEPARDVIEELLGAKENTKKPEDAVTLQVVSPSSEAEKLKRTADLSFIDDLVSQGGDSKET